MPSFAKNLQKFFVFFFTATSVVLVVMGVSRIKKSETLLEAFTPAPGSPLALNTLGSTTIKGDSVQTPWGDAVTSITVKNGKIIAATMPSIPDSPPSVYAVPILIDQAVRAGSANIQGVSGATYTSIAFKTSLESAISKAETQGQTIVANAPTAGSITTAKPSVPRKYRERDREQDDEEHEDDDEDEWDD
ncbi:MAG: hypothetical protein COV32_00575 [Candidatus Yonathbacteria bacterium CG10_big_fil_rev_8_21_14_0_10_43_136]|uniref:FMN-binding domain-containing protein n=2 Tax=Parcubacteria group TaxID=1794811 RepID=A0A2M7Q5C7_9BACT|nr:MAG: hypothetical protein AUK15_00340 [Candidatus Nomurabacteria bacterium CG2_30_43_9]PIQ35715.1 MAG: hypothetical protein COW60_02485 [Candidatus Yonathbacteria bacterium CG17_big_fil_post_rev_8_21_14_2_50_43_9]PIR40933.1 MAG: hypothetical protein COV32_00575 [Candidatus Yonathbacteria bacterium CG10_big_fil_rev_8_21_14_0_10_43_136]PIX57384.1 MAG: hypothetical protein COZ48_00835 [Candidatus Yonathbacteria bacterium CG_4_10_14_3_um_filter_43_12]PIY58275.1 MAG: hypothetical protein COY98_02